MDKLKSLTCTCCGGKINRATMRCEYCGTEYESFKNDIPMIRFETFQNPVKEYKACVLIDDDTLYAGGDAYMKDAIYRLCEEMMPAVMSGMRLRIEEERELNRRKIQGSLRIVMPKE